MSEGRNWLTAWVHNIALAFPLDRVREVMLWVPPQQGPPGRPGLTGVLPLRGESWPVWDLALRWGWAARRPGPESSYLLVVDSERQPMGAFLVDRTGWVLEAPATRIEKGQGTASDQVANLFDSVVADPESGDEYFVIKLDNAMDRVGIQ